MKWLVAALAVLNGALLLWALGPKQRLGPPPRAPQALIDAESMALLSERPPPPAAAPGTAAAARVCVRIGPFDLRDDVERAVRALGELGLEYREQTVAARQIRAFRVFTGPYAGADALRAARSRLSALGIEHYAIRDSAEAQSLSLGLFSQQATAQRFVAKLSVQDITAYAREEMRTLDPAYWLEVLELEERDERRRGLSEVDWGAAAARAREVPCE